MLKRIVTISENHEEIVAKIIDDLQEKGYEVSDANRISRSFAVFGKDISEIKYHKAL